jgi:hypothetical protein
VVTTANVATYDAERKTKTEQLMTEFKTSVLKCS